MKITQPRVARYELTQAIEPALSLSATLKNWIAIIRGLAESPRQRKSQEEGFKTSWRLWGNAGGYGLRV
jgi:hypothetical protein